MAGNPLRSAGTDLHRHLSRARVQMFEFRWHQTQLTFLEVVYYVAISVTTIGYGSPVSVLRVLQWPSSRACHRQETLHLSALGGNFLLGWPCVLCSSLLYVLAHTHPHSTPPQRSARHHR